jgi:hypothetical protein
VRAGKFPRSRVFWMGAGVLLVVLATGGGLALKWNRGADPTQSPFSDFLTTTRAGTVKNVVIDGDTLRFERGDGRQF